jgi:hypothetical protein
MGMDPNSNMMNAYYGMKQKMRNLGPMRVDPVRVPGKTWKDWRSVNMMTGGGMPPTPVPDKAPPFDPSMIVSHDADGDGVADALVGPPGANFKMLSRPGSGSGGSSHIQLTTLPDGSQVFVNKTTKEVTPVPGGEKPPSAHTAEDIASYKLRNKEIREQMDRMRRPDSTVNPASPEWNNKMKSLTDELKENNRLIGAHRPTKPKPQPQPQAQAPATPVAVKFDDYFDAQGAPTQQLKDLVAGDPAGVVRVLKQLEKQGDLTKKQVLDFLASIK